MPALEKLEASLHARSRELAQRVKTGRTHLMDAMPVTMGQEISGWHDQVARAKGQVAQAAEVLLDLPLGGTAVGTGINAPENFGEETYKSLAKLLGI